MRKLSTGLPSALGAAALILYAATAQAAAPQPDEDGYGYCILNSSGDDGPAIVGPNKCCFEEDAGQGDTLTVCIQCDSAWKNCREVWEDGTPGRGITLPATTGGKITTPPRQTTAPTLDLKQN